MRPRRLNPHRKFKIKIPRPSLPWLVTLGYCMGLLYLSFGPHFQLQRFICTTSTGDECPDFIIPEMEKYQHELVYAIQTGDLETRLIKNLPQADYVTVTPVWPDLLEAVIVWQHPIVNLSIPASSSALLVGNNGQILGLNSAPDPLLPTIIASSAADLIVSDHITEPSLQAAFEIVQQFTAVNLKTNLINVLSPQNIQVTLPDNKIAVFTSLKSVPLQVRTLQLILSQATINSGLRIIDLRLDRPALKPSL